MEIVVLDTETTGLNSPQACEISYFYLDSDFATFKSKLLDAKTRNFDFDFKEHLGFVFDQRFKPLKPIEPTAAKITGITNELVANCPSISTFQMPEKVEVIVGHNINYDHKVLSYADPANPLPLKLICTKELSQLAFAGDNITNNKLVTLFEHFYPDKKDQLTKAHGAYQDCLFVYMLLAQILERLPQLDSWEKMISICSQGKKTYEQLNKPIKELLTMPFGKHKGLPFDQVPTSYLVWLSDQDNLSPPLVAAIKKQLG